MINKQERNLKKEPKMQRTQILLDPAQYEKLVDLAHQEKQSMSSVVRQLLDDAFRMQKRRAWENAAEKMVNVYETDNDLTAFSDLDGEDFITYA